MPKPFLLGVEIEEMLVGPVMRAIKRLDGVVGVIDLDTQKKSGDAMPRANGAGVPRGPYKQRKPPGDFTETGEETVAKALHGKPPMTAKQLKDVFISQRRSPSSINSVLHKMKNQNEIQISPDGGYTLTKLMRDRMRSRKTRKAKK